MKYSNAKIIQFAKAPEIGRVKTRLVPALGEQGALDLHKQLVERVFSTITRAQLCDVELWVSGSRVDSFFNSLVTTEHNCPIRIQAGEDLGRRMAHAFQATLGEYDNVLIVGSDCPVLSSSYLEQALEVLGAGADVVLGPAEDGGYVLVGMSRARPEIFEGIEWGSGRVLQQTREKLKQLGIEWIELAQLWDVDRPEDLERLARLNED